MHWFGHKVHFWCALNGAFQMNSFGILLYENQFDGLLRSLVKSWQRLERGKIIYLYDYIEIKLLSC